MADTRIEEAVEERAELLRTLAATQHAKPQLAELQARLMDLLEQHRAASRRLGALHAAAEREQAEVRALQHQHVRQWFQDRGARRQQLAQEEQEAAAARRAADAAADAADALFEQIVALRGERDRLRVQADAGVAAAVALEALYGRVFAGPTPASAEEDALEARTQAVQAAHDGLQARVFVCGRVSNEVHLALACAGRAAAAVGVALAQSRTDMLVWGDESHATALAGAHQDPRLSSSRADGMERRALADVRADVARAEHHMAAAMQLAPDTDFVFYRPAVADAHSTTAHLDYWLDSPLTDYLFHCDLKATRDHVAVCHRVLADEAARADARLDAARRDLEPVAAQLDALRRELFSLRAAVFARVLHEDDPPPAYAEAG